MSCNDKKTNKKRGKSVEKKVKKGQWSVGSNSKGISSRHSTGSSSSNSEGSSSHSREPPSEAADA